MFLYNGSKLESDLDINSSECLKSYNLIGTTEYVNLCNDEINTVPWGVEDWSMFVIIILVVLFLIGLIVALVKEFIFDR